MYSIFVPLYYNTTIFLYHCTIFTYYSATKTGFYKNLLHLHFLRYFPYHHFRLLSSHTISTSTPYQNSPIPNTLPCTHPVSSGAISSLRYSTFLSLYPVKQRTIFLFTIFTLLHHPFCYSLLRTTVARSINVHRLLIVHLSIVSRLPHTQNLTPRDSPHDSDFSNGAINQLIYSIVVYYHILLYYILYYYILLYYIIYYYIILLLQNYVL